MKIITVLDPDSDNANEAVANLTNYLPMDADLTIETIEGEAIEGGAITMTLTFEEGAVNEEDLIQQLLIGEYVIL